MGNILQWLEREVRGEYLWCVLVWLGGAVLGLTGVTTYFAWVWDLPPPLIIQVVFEMVVFGVGLIALLIISANGLAERRARRKQAAPSSPVDPTLAIQPKTKPIEFYDSRTEKNSERGDLAKELAQSKRVWFAAIGGSQITDIPDATLQKLDRVLLIDPKSECMRMLIGLQPGRGNIFPHLVDQAIAKCQEKGKEIKLSDGFVLNVIISDPEEPDAWARVQSFIPYYLGQDSPSYVVRKAERPELFKRIKCSFEQMCKNATKPEALGYSQNVRRK
jgi:hypothetical protein